MAQNLNYFRLVGNLQMQIAQNLECLPFGETLSSDSNISTHKFTGRVSGFVLANPEWGCPLE